MPYVASNHTTLAHESSPIAKDWMIYGFDFTLMVVFFVVYGLLPRIVQPSKFRYAKTPESSKSHFQVVCDHFDGIFWMTLSCVFWKACMNPNLPESVPLKNYILYTFFLLFVGEVHFWAGHKWMHSNKFLYRHVHAHHHEEQYNEMEALDYIKQHPFEQWFLTMPLFYVTYLLPSVPKWYAFASIYYIHAGSLLGHTMYNISDSKKPLYWLFLPFTWPIVLYGMISRVCGIPCLGASPSRHHLHHRDLVVNYGLLFTVMDRWMGTSKSQKDSKARKAPASTRQEIALTIVLVQSAYLVCRPQSWEFFALSFYGLQLLKEGWNSGANAFKLLIIYLTLLNKWDDIARYQVLCNIVQWPLIFAHLTKKRQQLTAALVTIVRACVSVASLCILLKNSTFSQSQGDRWEYNSWTRIGIVLISLTIHAMEGCELARNEASVPNKKD